jgi:hypothetical protein
MSSPAEQIRMWFDVGICPIQDVRRLTESMVGDEVPARRLARRKPMVAVNVSAGSDF